MGALLVLAQSSDNGAVRRVAGCAASATYIPTADFNLRGAEWYASFDPIHANDRGTERIGRQMAEALIATGALKLRQRNAPLCNREVVNTPSMNVR